MQESHFFYASEAMLVFHEIGWVLWC